MATRRPRTSCNPCRLARIGCDAATTKPSRCSNCVRRGRMCDVASQVNSNADCRSKRASTGASAHEEEVVFQFYDMLTPPEVNDFMPLTPSSLSVETAACRRLQVTMLNDLLWDIYFSVFEMRYAIWLGDSCCPYLEMTPRPRVSIAKLVIEMDAHESTREAGSVHYRPGAPQTGSYGQHETPENNSLLNDALRHAIYAYSIRWVHIRGGYTDYDMTSSRDSSQREQEVRDYVWNRAKQAVLPALSRASYRSILALLLITIAEMPPDADNAGFAQLCNHAMFGHLNVLTSPIRWRVIQPLSNGSDFQSRSGGHPGLLKGHREEYSVQHQHNRDVIFWLCVVSGCSRALVQQLPAVIRPARSGDHKIWQFIRQRTVIFDQSFKSLQGSQLPLPQDVTEVVLQHATACKTMYLGIINQLCDAVFHHNPSSVKAAAQEVLDESRRFHQVFDHLLSMCSRDYTLLAVNSQLNYLLLLTHFHLGTLILADVVDTIEDIVPEELKEPSLSRLYACQAITNVLSLVLNCDRYSSGDDGDGPPGASASSKLLMDPAPDLMAEVAMRTCNAIFLMHNAGEIMPHAAQTMLSIVFNALDVLSQVSSKAVFVLALARDLCATRGLRVIISGSSLRDIVTSRGGTTTDSVTTGRAQSWTPSATTRHADHSVDSLRKFLQLMQLQASLDPSQLETMIKQYEKKYMGEEYKHGVTDVQSVGLQDKAG